MNSNSGNADAGMSANAGAGATENAPRAGLSKLARRSAEPGPHYKWIALSNTTLGVLMATINQSIVLIALPDIFRGIGLNPLSSGNTSYLLWMFMGFLVVSAVLVVSFGRLGDMFGRVRMYNMGFAIFTVASIFLTVTWMHGSSGALWLIIWRVVQGVGGAFLFANSTAILTDAFPANQRGTALGMNAIAAIAGSFLGLLLGGVLAPINWHLVFLVSAPIGAFATGWAYFMLRDIGTRKHAQMDWWGNVLFAAGLIAILIGITYGLLPYGGHPMGWTNPWVLTALFGGVAALVVFAFVETKVAEPLFRLSLFKIRAFAAGNIANLLVALGRGGMQFMLIIWLQGIWLPLHGYSFSQTPLWAGIYLVPLTIGFLVSAPLSGFLSDRYGARVFTTGGALLTALSFLFLLFLPVNFSYWVFALIIALNGFGSGLFASPNRAEMMNSVPANQRGAAGGMIATFQNTAFVLSIGIFFSLMVAGLSSKLPSALSGGLIAQGIPASAAHSISHLPPIGVLFAAFLGYNPMQQLLGPLLSHLPSAHAAYVTGRQFFPHLITSPFHAGLGVAFAFAIAANVLAAGASLLTGRRRRKAGAHESVGSELAAVAADSSGEEPSELVADGADDPDTGPAAAAEPGDAPATASQPANGDGNANNGNGDAGRAVAMAAATAAGAAAAQPPSPAPHNQAVPYDQATSYTAAAPYAPGTPHASSVPNGLAASLAPWETPGSWGAPAPAPNGQPAAAMAPATLAAAAPQPGDQAAVPADGSLVFGRVTQAGQTPLAAATVTVIDTAGRQAGRSQTTADGAYQVAVPGPGLSTFIAMAGAHQPYASVLRVGGQPAKLDVELAGAARLTGQVRAAAAGQPLAGVSVALTDERGAVLAAASTDPSGRYVIEDLLPGSYTVALSAPAYQPGSLPVVITDGQETVLDAELRSGARLEGVARTTAGAGVPDARVTLIGPDGNVAGVATTGADGTYRFENLPDGEYTVIASGYPPAASRLRVSPGQPHTHDVQLGHPEA
jgi:MFS family permease